MKAFKLRKYKFDLDEFQSHIDEVMTTKKQWLRAAPDKPDATWSYGIDDRLWANIGDALDPSLDAMVSFAKVLNSSKSQSKGKLTYQSFSELNSIMLKHPPNLYRIRLSNS